MHDPVMRDVLDKLRRFQAYSKEQGFPKVNLEDLVPPVSLDIKVRRGEGGGRSGV